MATNYPKENSGHTNSLEKGQNFEDFVCIELAKQNIILQNISSRKFQFETGENLQGFEIKYDARCTGDNGTMPTNRLSIEIAEKTKAENQYFVRSGIYRGDNSWLYIQGNYKGFWIFAKKILTLLHESGRYKEAELPTVKKFYLPLADADKYCAKKIILEDVL
ncbi:MAG: hypothetical protein EOM23_01465 [Candidatus Moranbacteria bacterium]|nr:hypothetical protein [Candidatus Moranbacteria bacterium]